MTHNERIIKVLVTGVNRIKQAETNAELYATLRVISAIAKQESKRVLVEMGIDEDNSLNTEEIQ